MHNFNNITVYNNAELDSSPSVTVVATVKRDNSNSHFTVRRISISEGFSYARGPHQLPPELELRNVYRQHVGQELTQNDDYESDSSDSYTTYNVTNDSSTTQIAPIIVTAWPTYVNPESGFTATASAPSTSVNNICTERQAMSSLNLQITLPASLLSAATGETDTVYAVTVIMDRPGENESYDLCPDDASTVNRRVSRTAVGFIIVDGFGSLSFTWSTY
jgi:hypothetical protein